MSTAIGLTILAGASCLATLMAVGRLFRRDATVRNQRIQLHANYEARGPIEDLKQLRDAENGLEAQVATLRAMILQLRAELAEAQRENEQSRLRDLELLRFRRVEQIREVEARAGASDRAPRRRDEPLVREAAQLLTFLG